MTPKEKQPRVTEVVFGRRMRAAVLENDLISTTVLLDQGADIHTLIYKPRGIDVLWKSPVPVREPGVGPPPSGDSLILWSTYYRGGWQTIFPNFGPSVEYKGSTLDFHGEAARSPWKLERIERDDRTARLTLQVELIKSPFVITRQMSVEAHRPVLSLSETVTNRAKEAIDCMWGHHPAFSQPLLSPQSFIDCGAKAVWSDDTYDVPGNDLPLGENWSWPFVRNTRGEPLDLSRIPGQESRHSRVLFLKDFTEGWYALTNPKLGLGIGLVWDSKLFPYACFWQETGGVTEYPWFGQAYVTAIEPNSSFPGHGLNAVMKKTSSHLTFPPGESRTLEIKAVFYEGNQRVSQIDRDCNVTRMERS